MRLKLDTERTLGIRVDPAQVRILPKSQPGYTWKVLPETEHLFTKHLSKLSVGTYMKLCREVGESFEAVAPSASSHESLYKEPEVRQRF